MGQTTLVELQKQVNNDVIDSYKRLKTQFELGDNKLIEAIEYALLGGGKRVRPLLHRIVSRLLGADENDAKVCELSLECIHAYSLIHDDLPSMDNDELRRGLPTVHIAFDEATAILAGDALQTLAFEWLSEATLTDTVALTRNHLVSTLAKSTGVRGMCMGQALDLAATDNTIDVDTLIRLHTHKTGALLKASVQMAIEISPEIHATSKQVLMTYADAIGMAFQIQDDILDVTADTGTLGKPQGSDAFSNKSTFVTHYGLEGAQTELRKKQDVALSCLNQLNGDTEELASFTDLMVSRKY